MIKFDILNRFSGNVQFTAEIDCADDAPRSIKIGLAVKLAIKSGADLYGANLSRADLSRANLSRADLSGANLSRADLSGADLSRANLSGANLSGANLSRADLSGADLSGANLSGADLSGADLSGADLSRADLSGADLSGANLSRADLSGADLSGANLSGANLRHYRNDLWSILLGAQNEVPGLIQALREGRVDGSTYSGVRACLVGTIANVRGVDVENLEKDSSRPAEQWFLMIREGDKPTDETGGGFAAKMALEWALEFSAMTGISVPEDRAIAAAEAP